MIKNILKKVSPIISILSIAVILYFAVTVFLNSDKLDSENFQAYLWWTNIMSFVWFCFSPWWLIKEES